mmetsp:Transcript_95066/g.306219  ORF Transcript_95066/g.306219 Transcript_95066/m.306219 type:complete len:346 (-) Transcript_95066:1359-2396(-)
MKKPPSSTAAPASDWSVFWNSMNPQMQKASSLLFNTNTATLSQNIPDTTMKGAGYVRACDSSKCSSADTNYYMKAVLKSITTPGSKQIETATPGTYPNDVKVHTVSDEDVTSYTRHLDDEGRPELPFGPAIFGGDGSGGLLGPALQVLPGQTMNLFVMSEIDPSYQQDHAPTAENHAQKVDNKVQTAVRRMGVRWVGKGLSTSTAVGEAVEEVFHTVTATQMDMNSENVPGRPTTASTSSTSTSKAWRSLRTSSIRWADPIPRPNGSPLSRRPQTDKSATATSSRWHRHRARACMPTTRTATALSRCQLGTVCLGRCSRTTTCCRVIHLPRLLQRRTTSCRWLIN